MMSSTTDPATEYMEMQQPETIPTKISSSSNVTVDLHRLDNENPSAPQTSATLDHNQQQHQTHDLHTNYVTMTSELPPDRFEDEFDGLDDDNDVDDHQSMAITIAESVMTDDGIHDGTGFNIVCLVILVGDMSRGVFFPTMWPLVSALGGSTVTLGYAVAAFSFGRILVSPLFGAWSETYGYRTTLLTSCIILLLGTFLHAQVQNIGRPGFLIFSQTILGVGSGTLGVTRAYVAEVTAQRSRTTYMAWITAVQYAGFTVTPFVGAFFIKVLDNIDFQLGYVGRWW
jgi:fucose permease